MIKKNELSLEEFLAFCQEHDTTHCNYAIQKKIPELFYDVDFLNEVISTRPEIGFAYILRAEINNANDQALADIEKALSLNPESGFAYTTRASFYCDQHKFDEAIADINRAIKLDLTDPYPHFLLSTIHFVQNKLDQALVHINKAIEIDPNFEKSYFFRGQIHLEEKEYELAIEDFKKNLDIVANNIGSYQKICEIYILQKKYAEALEFLVIRQNFLTQDAFLRLRAHVYEEKGDIQWALQDLISIRNYKDDGSDHHRLGIIYSELQRYQEALQSFNQAITLSPNDHTYFSDRAAAQKEIGDVEKTIQDYEMAIKLGPEEEYYYEELATILKEHKRLNEAIKWLNQGLLNNQQSASLYLQRSQYHYENNNFRRACEDLKLAVVFANNSGIKMECDIVFSRQTNKGYYKELVEQHDVLLKLHALDFSSHSEKLRQFNLQIKRLNEILKKMNAIEFIQAQYISPSSLKLLCKLTIERNKEKINYNYLADELNDYLTKPQIEAEPVPAEINDEPREKIVKYLKTTFI